jgi:hypothetical protein
MGLDLMKLTDAILSQDYEPVRKNVESAGRFLLELREYCCPPVPHWLSENLAEIVETVTQEVARAWEQKAEGATRVRLQAPYVTLEADWRQIKKALARTISCAYALAPPEGGEVIVEAGLRTQGVQQFIDFRVRIYGAAPFSIEEETLFLPFASVNGRQLGLSLVLAQRAASQLGGHLLFHKLSPRQGCFTLWFRI